MTRLSSMPAIEELLDNPSRVADLPTEAARALFVRLAGLQAALTVAVLPASAPEKSPSQKGDRFLDAEEVDAMIGKSRSWVEHNVDELPERRRVGGEGRWSEREIQRWMQNRPHWDDGP
jgi:predicted DNA-binding transcriptional regulator AlpA